MGKSKKKGKKGNTSQAGPQAGIVGEKDEISPDKSRPGKCEDFYTLSNQLGTGGMSVVYEGLDKTSNTKWAVKVIEKQNVADELDILQREITIMKNLRHPNVLQLREVFEQEDKIFLVTELVTGGELFEKIVEVGNYSEADAATIIKQVVDGVEYLHGKGVAHRDLKPENLLVGGANEDEIKIADFGLSKSFGSDAPLQTSCGTPDYVAPEVLHGEKYDKSVDLWSIGVITYILLCGFPPFWGDTQAELFEKIMTVDYDFPEPEWTEVSDEAKDFIKSLLVKDPKERFTAKQTLDHPWLKKYAKAKFGDTSKHGELRSLASVSNLKEYAEKRKQ